MIDFQKLIGKTPSPRSPAYNLGWNVGYAEEPKKNPFKKGSEQYNDWVEGFEMGSSVSDLY